MIKHFYRALFKTLPSYQRIIYLINQHQLALQALLFSSVKSITNNNCDWIDSSTLPVRKNQLIGRHKSLKEGAISGKSSIGWFYSCKVHVLVNQYWLSLYVYPQSDGYQG